MDTIDLDDPSLNPFGFSAPWCALGIVDAEALRRLREEWDRSEDHSPEHYRYGAFKAFLARRRPLGAELAQALFELGLADPDEAMGGAMAADVLRLPECPAALLTAALTAPRKHLVRIAEERHQDEANWLTSTDAVELLNLLRSRCKTSSRKLRLLACAFCREVEHLLTGEARHVLEVAEKFADGLARPVDLFQARGEARQAEKRARAKAGAAVSAASRAARLAAHASADAAASEALHSCMGALNWEAQTWGTGGNRSDFVVVIRELFGNPFRFVALTPASPTPMAVDLARAAYEERELPSGRLDRHRLAVLADALEEVGANQALLDHLRGPGPHYRGCFAVDLCLARE
jgi:hypothetical protein